MRALTIDTTGAIPVITGDTKIIQGENIATALTFKIPTYMADLTYVLKFKPYRLTPIITDPLTPLNNAVTYNLPSAVTMAAGYLEIELNAYHLDGTLAKTSVIKLTVSASIDGDTISVESFIPWPQQLINTLGTKADKTYVDTQDAFKVNKTVTINGKALSDNISLSAADLANTPTTGIAATNVQAALEELASFAPATQGLTTVTNKNQYYPIAENNLGAVVGQHQLNIWNGSAWVASNGYGLGHSALTSNTGAQSNGFGHSALTSNTGAQSNGFGYYALLYNTGAQSNGFGHSALTSNTGGSSNGFGYTALTYNTGSGSNGFGYSALTSNTGGYSNGFGYTALSYNTGAQSNGFGYAVLRYNQSTKNTAVGNEANSTFLDNVAGAKTADSTAVDITLERVTLTAHGFGANNAIVNVKYTANDTAIGGLIAGTIYQVKIIDANTIEFATGATKRNLTSQGVGTHTFTPQFAYENTTCLGASTVPNKSNQVVLGDTLVDTIKMGGTARTPASSTATGVKGETCWDANYIYVCVATDTWVRSALTTW